MENVIHRASLRHGIAARRYAIQNLWNSGFRRLWNAPCISGLFQLHQCSIMEHKWSRLMDLSIKGVPEEQVARLRDRAKANHRSLQGELRALIDEATFTV